MKARLYRSRSIHDDFGRSYFVVCRGVTVGEIQRNGHGPWSVFADYPSGCKHRAGFVRRGDAKRWVVKNQGMVTA
jgi:hypothetical protein